MKIPKIIFQTDYYKPPMYANNILTQHCPDWNYSYFSNFDAIEYVKNNPVEDFKNTVDILGLFNKQHHKEDFFKLYFLYLNGGVHITSIAVLKKNLDEIVKDFSFFTVESLLNNNSYFHGFIGCEPKNFVIYETLKEMYTNYERYNNNELSMGIQLWKQHNNLKKIAESMGIDLNYKIFNEKMSENNISSTYDDADEEVLTHYFGDQIVKCAENNPILEKVVKPPNETKIGITFDLPNTIIALYSNGIRQNVLYFNELLLNIGYDSYLIVDDKKLNDTNKEELNKLLYDGKFKCVKVSEMLSSNFDVVFNFGFSIPNEIKKYLKYMKVKIVAYFCGNSYFIDSEKILYSQHREMPLFDYNQYYYDELWSIPQMVNMNQYYWQILYRSKCIEVPFIWSDKSIEFITMAEKDSDFTCKIKNKDEQKIAIFEPNISLMKWFLPCLLICENTFRNMGNNKLKHVYITNIPEKGKNKINDLNVDMINKIASSLDLRKNGKISIESRYNSLYFMKTHADIAVSHQMENPLNYLYLDLAWMGWPILHNAHLAKDIGYYYEGFNYEAGSKMLENIIHHHHENIDEYIKTNRKNIERFLPSNIELQQSYKTLIDNLFTKNA
jgi:hypothetical protein